MRYQITNQWFSNSYSPATKMNVNISIAICVQMSTLVDNLEPMFRKPYSKPIFYIG